MKDYQGFKNNGNWYKGNLHSHTTVSDGKMTPEQSVEVYKSMDTIFWHSLSMIFTPTIASSIIRIISL